MSADFGEDFNSPLDGYFGTVSGRQLLQQDILYRLSQDPGNEIIDDENYGIDVRKLVNESFSPGQLVELAARVQLEVRKDDRVEACTVSARLGADRKLYLDISVTDADGPFPLTLSVDQVSVTQIVRQ